MNTLKKTDRKAQLEGILRGIAKRFAAENSFLLGGVIVTKSDLVKAIQAELDAIQASADARALHRVAVGKERALRASLVPVLKPFKGLVVSQFGDTATASDALGDFGYTPRKVSPKTAAAKQLAAEKGNATRVVRHTMGPKQKAKVKGTVAPEGAPLPLPLPSGNGGPKPM